MKQIAVCGVSDRALDILGTDGNCQITQFGDGPTERGEVKLLRFLQKSELIPDLILVGYSGAAGLAACDYLCSRLEDTPILWLCDRAEFESEARKMGVDFLYTGE